ncbi:MAG TPA: glycosyltransferase family 9 protein [Bryobacteraceae bacterium]|jgi:ADP-heptose:LPS heptosyltransferase|nr:glycosyltransferase family 9 protein [Bryobacteraceae bacterium]
MTVVDRLPPGARVCIIRLRSLGDCVLTTPAIELLKRARPDLQIGVVVEERFRSLFEDHPSISGVLSSTWDHVWRFKPHLCINLHGGTRSQWLTAVSGARWRAGFANHSFTLAYNLKIPRAQRILGVNRIVHTAEHLASAVFALGVPLQDVPRARLQPGDSPIAGRYAVLHPFASTPEKRWPAERFCEVARYLTLWNINPIFIAAPADDIMPFQGYRVFQGSLREVKAVMSKAALFIGNDSGPAHMAAAFGVPSLVLFSTSNAAIWGPWRTDSEVVIAPDGMAEVSVSRVIAALERLRTLEEAHA